MRETLYTLDEEDLKDYRKLYAQRECGIMYNVPLSMEEAVKIELDSIAFQHYLFQKYLAGEDLEDKDWHIDEVTGEIWLWG
jgi:hypothetical protein